MGSLISCQLKTLWIHINRISGIAVLLVVSTQLSSSSDQKGWTYLYSFPPTRCIGSIGKKLVFAGFREKDLSFKQSNWENFWKNVQNPSSWTKNCSVTSSISLQLSTLLRSPGFSTNLPTTMFHNGATFNKEFEIASELNNYFAFVFNDKVISPLPDNTSSSSNVCLNDLDWSLENITVLMKQCQDSKNTGADLVPSFV